MAKNKTKRSPQKLAKKFEQELPEVAKRHNIRVSSPYGYYPEDTDKIILQLEKDVSNLTKENKLLSQELYETKENLSKIQTELTQFKMQMSLMEIPDVSPTENFAMLSRMSTINGQNMEMPIEDIDVPKPSGLKTISVQSSNTNTDGNTIKKQSTYSNLIKPRENNTKQKIKL